MAQTVGLFVNTAQAFEGYTLFAPSGATTTYLVDMDGREVHNWPSAYEPMSAYLQPNGDLLRVARLPNTAATLNAPGASGRIELIGWDGALKWYFELNTPDARLHHDIELMPNGNILAISWDRYTRAEALAEGRNPNLPLDNNGEVWPDTIIEIQPNYLAGSGGSIVWKWSLWDHLVQQYDATKQNYGDVASHPELIDVNYLRRGEGAGGVAADWTHFNSVDYNAELDQIMVSSREFSEFWIIDHSTTTAEAASGSGGASGQGGDILYRWGNPAAYNQGTRANQQLSYQHDAQWVEPGLPGAGNILVFNNGWNRANGSNYSSVVELAPPTRGQNFYLNNKTDGSITNLVQYSAASLPAGWTPLVGDWDGNGTDTTGFYDPATQTWLLNNSAATWTSSVTIAAPPEIDASWLPLVGDWDNDGRDTPGLYNPTTREFRLSNGASSWTASASFAASSAGLTAAWLPIVGDWNGDGVDSVGLYDPDSNNWLLSNGAGSWSSVVTLLAPVDVPASWRPIAGDWNRDGRDSVGLYDPVANRWYLNNRIDGTIADMITVVAPQAPARWIPLAGDFDNDGFDTIGLYDPNYYSIGVDGATYGPTAPLWEYTSTPRSNFFATIISGAQRLPNGNTLINEGTEGRFFEVTPSKQVVWDYISPVVTGGRLLAQGENVPAANFGIPGVNQNLVFRAYRYAPSYLSSSLDVTPGNPIELYKKQAFDTIGFYKPTTGDWELNNQVDGSMSDVYRFSTGASTSPSWLPVTGDWDGDGVDSVGLYNPATRTWRLTNRNDSSSTSVVQFSATEGGSNWLPIAGDWNNDGIDTVGLYDPDSNNWLLSNQAGGWGSVVTLLAPVDVPSTWRPIAGDWNGDGFDTVGLYDPATNNWYLNNRIDGTITDLITLRAPVRVPSTWIPLAGDWNGNNHDTVALYDPANRIWYLNNRVDGSISDLVIVPTRHAGANWMPLAGDWNGMSASPVMAPPWNGAGDVDRSGNVDGNDFLAWQRNLGPTSGQSLADWSNYYGVQTASLDDGEGSAANVVVAPANDFPEASLVALASRVAVDGDGANPGAESPAAEAARARLAVAASTTGLAATPATVASARAATMTAYADEAEDDEGWEDLADEVLAIL